MWDLLLRAFVKYVESHPEVVEQAVEKLVKLLLAKLDDVVK